MEKNIEQDKCDEKVLGLLWDKMNVRLKFDCAEISAIVRRNSVEKRLVKLEDRYPVEFGEEHGAVGIDGDYQDETVTTIEPEIKFVADEEVDE